MYKLYYEPSAADLEDDINKTIKIASDQGKTAKLLSVSMDVSGFIAVIELED